MKTVFFYNLDSYCIDIPSSLYIVTLGLKIAMIELINLKPGDIIQTSIAYIFGKCIDLTDTIELIDSFEQKSYWQVKNCFFKVCMSFN